MVSFRRKILESVIERSDLELDLFYDAIELIDKLIIKKKVYKFSEIESLVFGLRKKWISGIKRRGRYQNRHSILWTFILSYECYSIKEIFEKLKRHGVSITTEQSLTRYQNQAISDIRTWVASDDEFQNKFRLAIGEELSGRKN